MTRRQQTRCPPRCLGEGGGRERGGPEQAQGCFYHSGLDPCVRLIDLTTQGVWEVCLVPSWVDGEMGGKRRAGGVSEYDHGLGGVQTLSSEGL